jgi:hypothetical protein
MIMKAKLALLLAVSMLSFGCSTLTRTSKETNTVVVTAKVAYYFNIMPYTGSIITSKYDSGLMYFEVILPGEMKGQLLCFAGPPSYRSPYKSGNTYRFSIPRNTLLEMTSGETDDVPTGSSIHIDDFELELIE